MTGRGARPARPRLGAAVVGRRRHAGVRLQARAHARRRLPDVAATRASRAAPGSRRVDRGGGAGAAGRRRRSPPTTSEAIRYGDDDPALAAHAFELLIEAGESAIARAALRRRSGCSTAPGSPRTSATAAALVALARGDREARLTTARVRACRGGASSHGHRRPAPRLRRSRLADAPFVAVRPLGCGDAVAAEAIEALAGLPESPALAAALARRSQLEMLRGTPDRGRTPRRRSRWRAGRRRLRRDQRADQPPHGEAARGVRPDRDEALVSSRARSTPASWTRPTASSSTSSGRHRLTRRSRSFAIGRRWWNGSPACTPSSSGLRPVPRALAREVPLDPERRMGSGRRGAARASETAVDGAPSPLERDRLRHGAASGDLEAADELLPEWIEKAIASQEPQRIIPMAAIALARAALAGDAPDRPRDHRDGPRGRRRPGPVGTARDRSDSSRDASGSVSSNCSRERRGARRRRRTTARYAHAVSLTCSGLRALAEGRPTTPRSPLPEVVALERERGALYIAACAELDLALALDARRGRGGSRGTRARRCLSRPLGCVNPV